MDGGMFGYGPKEKPKPTYVLLHKRTLLTLMANSVVAGAGSTLAGLSAEAGLPLFFFLNAVCVAASALLIWRLWTRCIVS